MKMSRGLSRLTAALGAFAVAAVGLIGGGAVANAAASPGNIDLNALGSLTIHKYMNQPPGAGTGNISTGAVSDPGFVEPVEGVVFTAYRLGTGSGAAFTPLDLGVAANWNGLSVLIPGPGCVAPAGYTLGPGTALPATNASGTAVSPSLPVGAYVVCETDVSNAKVNGQTRVITQPAQPFILAIPTPFENGWLYDVHAFPKNGGFVPATKTTLPQLPDQLSLGSKVRFQVNVDVPRMTVAWTEAAITDVLDPRLKPASPVSDAVGSVEVWCQGSRDHTFTSGTDYEIITNGTQGIGIHFLPPGLALFANNAKVGCTLQTTFVATVDSLGSGAEAGIIKNQAGVWTNVSVGDWNNPPLKSSVTTTNWGDIRIRKHAADTGLAGAKFQVYPAAAPYPSGECSTNILSGAVPMSFNGTTTFTSNAQGLVVIPGVFVSDSDNTPTNATTRCYVLVETEAPAGYVLPTNNASAVAVGIGNTAVGTYDVSVENTQQTVPELPVTGAAGRILLIVAGIGGAALVVGLMIVNRRRTMQ